MRRVALMALDEADKIRALTYFGPLEDLAK
jgi:hypothetical protein